MATVAPPSANQASDLLQKLALDAQPKTLEIPEPTKKTSANRLGSVTNGKAANGQIQPYEPSVTPSLPDFEPTMCFVPTGYPPHAYYYGGFEGTGGEWDDFSRYANTEGVDMASGYYGENGSLMYQHGYGFAPFAPYSPATSPVPGNDQTYGTQHYHYPSPYYQSMTPTPTPFTTGPAAPPSVEQVTSAAGDQKPLPAETVNANSNGATKGAVKGSNKSFPSKMSKQKTQYNINGSFGRGSLPGGMAPGCQDPRFGFEGLCSPFPFFDGSVFSDGQLGPVANPAMINSFINPNNGSARNQHAHPTSNFTGLHHTRPISGMGLANGFMNGMYPRKLYGQYDSTMRSNIGFGRSWSVDNKYKNRGHGNVYWGHSHDNMDGLNELNRGPRAKDSKNQKDFTSILAVEGKNMPSNGDNVEKENRSSAIPDCTQYNKVDFPEDYDDAKFFIIKSYSEDDVHKSIKYNVWASTPNGNKKLDAAYREAQEKAGGCPVFLFFSVNTSGQFVGLAEMVGPVDFHKNVEYWQQDKWMGCFPVKWHVVKDVPNNLLKLITLENNENKPVTNSRDTQEVKLPQGLKMIKIFQNHPVKTCLLDDFEFYENRQKAIQEKKARQLQFQKQVWGGKPAGEKKEIANGELKPQECLQVASDFTNESTQNCANGDLKHTNGGMTEKTVDDPNSTRVLSSEKKVVPNGVANAC
ncbi:YTH domain-containing protein ECT4-like [Rhodamnia argentea]|uniref:YTH domain-containing family protein n=1 Tax=Rhodamnia argentea TaxID=178133 RepID=A0A8B8QKA6_9MYRT|nr:YTH domain-containing protein ECT4-like [Rhodamnia argentea]